jgi:hypothetical protein
MRISPEFHRIFPSPLCQQISPSPLVFRKIFYLVFSNPSNRDDVSSQWNFHVAFSRQCHATQAKACEALLIMPYVSISQLEYVNSTILTGNRNQTEIILVVLNGIYDLKRIGVRLSMGQIIGILLISFRQQDNYSPLESFGFLFWK